MEFSPRTAVHWVAGVLTFYFIKSATGMPLWKAYPCPFLLQQVETNEAGVLVTQIPIRHFTVFILDSEVHRIYF